MYLGVDFGTAYSQVAICENGRARRLHMQRVPGIQSFFYYDSEQDILTGIDAVEAANGISANNLVRDVKMKIGQCFNLDGRVFGADEIIKSLYGAVVEFAKNAVAVESREMYGEETTDLDIDGIVVSHPAKFSMTEINTLINAAANCIDGKRVRILGTIKEPVAAALAYYNDCNKKSGSGKGILVYDLGGGTCDIALVCEDKNELAEYTVIDSDMVRIGGRDWDKALFDYFVDEIESKNLSGKDILSNPINVKEILKAVDNAKKSLSDKAEAHIKPNLVIDDEDVLFDVVISRSTFEELTLELLDETMNKLEEVYDRNCDNIDIEEIICVGGASNMPQVREALEDRFRDCDVKMHTHKPEYAVVEGAAIYAQKIVDELKSHGHDPNSIEACASLSLNDEVAVNRSVASIMLKEFNGRGLLSDVLPLSYGIRCKRVGNSNEYVVKNLLRRGDKMPISASFGDFAPAEEGTEVKIEICESECTDEIFACDSGKRERVIGTVTLNTPSGIGPNNSISCTLSISSLDIIEAEAHDDKGNAIEVQVNLNQQRCNN